MKEKYFSNRTKVLKVKEKYSPWKIASVPKRGKIYFPIAASFKTGWKEFPDGLIKRIGVKGEEKTCWSCYFFRIQLLMNDEGDFFSTENNDSCQIDWEDGSLFLFAEL